MESLKSWIEALTAEGLVLAEVRVVAPWSDFLIADGVLPAGQVAPADPGEEAHAVVIMADGSVYRGVLCV